MPTSTSRLSFQDCFDYLDRALADDKGIRIGFNRYGDAMQFRLRCNKARAVDRQENAETYESTHPLFGRSEYDCLLLRVVEEDGQAFVYFQRKDALGLRVESLSEVEERDEEPDEPEPEPEKVERRV